MVHRIYTLVDTQKKWRPLGQGSLTTMTVVQDGPSWERRSVVDVHQSTLRKNWRSLGIRSLTTITVVQDGPSWERQFVAYIRWWTLRENEQWGIGTDPMTVCHVYDGSSLGLVLLFSYKTEDATIIPTNQTEYLILTYMFLTQIPSKLAMRKHQFHEF